jgi:DNA-binding MarR family transcriptional regulator
MDVDQDKIRALAGFRSALRKFMAFSEEATSGAGITTQQYQAMLAIAAEPHGTMPVGELAQEMLLKPNATVQLVDRLSALGLVERGRSQADRRSVRVSLSSEGRALLMKLAAVHLDQLARRKKQFADILRRLKQTQSD